jgi:hypothetical protein
MPPAIIAAGIGAGGMLGSSWLGSRKSQQEKDALAAQTAGMNQQTGMAKTLQDFSKNQFTMSGPAQKMALDYYTKLATGNRGTINEALAPEYGQISDIYRGGMAGAQSRMAPGPIRDQAIADMQRQKSGQMAMLPMQARAGGMKSLADFGQAGAQAGMQALSGASWMTSAASSGAGNLFNMAQAGNQRWSDMGESIGKIFLPWVLNQYGGGKGGFTETRGGVTTPSRVR